MNDEKKGCVLGVGGIFFRSKDPGHLGSWYAEHLGFEVEEWGDTRGSSFSPAKMPAASFTVWSVFAANTEYFGSSGQSYMINLVVDDLDAALENVAAGGAEVLEQREEHDFGRFGWFVDPDGNRVELWEPLSGMSGRESKIQSRIDELESRLAFQDDLIEALNEVVSRQDRELVRLANQLKTLSERFAEMAESAVGSEGPGGHEIPPHY